MSQDENLMNQMRLFLEALPSDLGRGSLNGMRVQLLHKVCRNLQAAKPADQGKCDAACRHVCSHSSPDCSGLIHADAEGSLPVVATMAKGPVIYFTKPVENGLKDLPVGQYDLTPISYATAEIADLKAACQHFQQAILEMTNVVSVKDSEIAKRDVRITHLIADRDDCLEARNHYAGEVGRMIGEVAAVQTELTTLRAQMEGVVGAAEFLLELFMPTIKDHIFSKRQALHQLEAALATYKFTQGDKN